MDLFGSSTAEGVLLLNLQNKHLIFMKLKHLAHKYGIETRILSSNVSDKYMTQGLVDNFPKEPDTPS